MNPAEQIALLRAQGWTVKAIGAALDRDPSLVSKVARGIKPGSNLGASLARLGSPPARGSAPPSVPAPRRLSRSGEPARVRGGRRPADPARTPSPPPPDSARSDVGRARGATAGEGWRLAGWRERGGEYHNVQAGDAPQGGAPFANPERVQLVTLQIDSLRGSSAIKGDDGYVQWYVDLTEDFDLADVVAEVEDTYGDV